MYVIKKDGIKRYVGDVEIKVPSDTIENNKWEGSYFNQTILWNFKVPEGITMLKLHIYKDIFIKVRPLQEIVIRGKNTGPTLGGVASSYFVNQHKIIWCLVYPIRISFSKEINSYSGKNILDISNEENQRE